MGGKGSGVIPIAISESPDSGDCLKGYKQAVNKCFCVSCTCRRNHSVAATGTDQTVFFILCGGEKNVSLLTILLNIPQQSG